ncbi:hypothetical protein [Blastococcus saxobsidens]|uniref:ESAT-6 protein secretion system EspG family protein n=1 Tax=Blastococcus saxobsidens (strain DD2) TaxID=1146883 RepID=H6RP19_BLASD|nr:hypothetical protein [Blastococcus saxobsidens]CCG02680.1 exported protein of unknown function [Blastococcus saxobsidens DD2]
MSAEPRRQTLTAAGWSVVAAGRLTHPPAAFAPVPLSPGDRDVAISVLVGAGIVVRHDGGAVEPVPPLAADLATLGRPLLTVELEVTGRTGARQGWLALGRDVVVGLLTLADGGVELSLAPAVRLGAELARAVPHAAELTGPWPAGEEPGDGVPTAGPLPLALLEDVLSPDATAEERALAQELERRTAGSLSCRVAGRAGSAVGSGEVSWLATHAGWVGLRPRLGGEPRRMLDLVPVEPGDIGTWVAPTVGALLGNSDGRP